jgi:U3 small nucleolar RNA-associated protein 23
MRIKRGKKYHKFVNFYRVVYKFVPPFKVLLDGNFIFSCTKNSLDLKPNLQKILQDQPLMFMTKCILRELENLKSQDIPFIKETLAACAKIVKLPCKHSGGILNPDECIKNFVGSKNESKVFVGTNDEALRNYFRNELGTVPLFFLQNNVLIMDSPSDVSQAKF